jgi:hypothetical protein
MTFALAGILMILLHLGPDAAMMGYSIYQDKHPQQHLFMQATDKPMVKSPAHGKGLVVKSAGKHHNSATHPKALKK